MLRHLLVAAVCLTAVPTAVVGESWRSFWRRSESSLASSHFSHLRVFRFGPGVKIGCFLITEEEPTHGSRPQSDSTSIQMPERSHGPPVEDPNCPNGVTYFDGCNACSCGEHRLCTLKACSKEDQVKIYDPCLGVRCGHRQRCQAICVGQICQLRARCVSDDAPDCENCPWICVDERNDCGDRLDQTCHPSLACYRPNM